MLCSPLMHDMYASTMPKSAPEAAFAGRRAGLPRRVLVAGMLVLAATGARAEGWAPSLTLSATWHDNASNASAASDRIGALQTGAELRLSERYDLARNDSLHVSARFAGDVWRRYSGLTGGSAGMRAEWQHKFGLGARAPVASVELAADAVTAKESGRRGTSTGVTLALRKRVGDLWRVTLKQEFARHDARQAVFDRAGAETALEFVRDLTESAWFGLRLNYRKGTVLSYATPPRPDLVALAQNLAEVETFGRPMVAYSIEARSAGARASYIGALSAQSAVILAYEWRDTERSPFKYVNHLVSLALVHQF